MKRLALIGLLAGPAAAEANEDFVTANLLSILYHELGHAIIDVGGLPVFGQEEDAADVASILLVDYFFEEDSARAIAVEAAYGFLSEAEASEADGAPVAWWDVHGPDLQRYYNLVCIFVGADPDARDDLAEDLDLPEERFETCGEEFDLAWDSWGPVFDELAADAPGQSLVFEGAGDSLTSQVVAEEVAALNEAFVLPEPVVVRVEPCGEANAFYDPGDFSITMCTEFEDWLREIAPD